MKRETEGRKENSSKRGKQTRGETTYRWNTQKETSECDSIQPNPVVTRERERERRKRDRLKRLSQS